MQGREEDKMTSQIYLDACIFIAFEHSKHKNYNIVRNCISCLKDYDMDIFSSEWALVEMCKVLMKEFQYPKSKVEKIANKYRMNLKIGDVKIKFLDVNTDKKYRFKEFFEHLRNEILDVKEIHLADAIHNLIMSNNKIENILTTDQHFSVLKEITTVHPNVFKVMKPKNI